jgi:hypothetical protein
LNGLIVKFWSRFRIVNNPTIPLAPTTATFTISEHTTASGLSETVFHRCFRAIPSTRESTM